MKFRIKKHPLNIYPRTLYICKGGKKEDVEKLFCNEDSEMYIEEDVVESSDALTLTDVMHKRSKEYCVVIWLQERVSVGTIAHEAFHATNAIMRALGIKHDLENDEPMAYLVGYIADCIAEINKK